jgi:hypothetical protein
LATETQSRAAALVQIANGRPKVHRGVPLRSTPGHSQVAAMRLRVKRMPLPILIHASAVLAGNRRLPFVAGDLDADESCARRSDTPTHTWLQSRNMRLGQQLDSELEMQSTPAPRRLTPPKPIHLPGMGRQRKARVEVYSRNPNRIRARASSDPILAQRAIRSRTVDPNDPQLCSANRRLRDKILCRWGRRCPYIARFGGRGIPDACE